MNVLDQVEKTLDADKAATESSYKELVAKLAKNANVPQDEIIATLKACGRKLSELKQDVDKERRCNDCRKVINDKPAVLKRLRKAEAAKAEFHQRQQASFKAFRDEAVKVTTELNQARTAFAAIGKAADELEQLTGEVVELPIVEPEPDTASQAPTTARKAKRS